MASKLLELYVRLKELGNPRYFKGTIDPLPCSIGRQEADHRVQETAQTLESWRNRVIELRSQYDWLLFFSIPKILRLYKLLSAKDLEPNLQLDRIVHEISFLCKNNQPTKKELGRNVQVICIQVHHNMYNLIVVCQYNKYIVMYWYMIICTCIATCLIIIVSAKVIVIKLVYFDNWHTVLCYCPKLNIIYICTY